MTDYTKTTDFAAKDSLPSGDSGKIIKGTEFETEFDNIATAIATKSNIASPTFTGTTTIPTVDINGGAIDAVTLGTNSAVTEAQVDNININGNTISSSDTNGNVNISPNGTGTVVINTDLDVDNINVNGNAIISTDTNGNIDLTPNGTGEVNISKVDIDSGAIDGTVIGAASAAAITGTTITGTSFVTSGNMTFGDNDKAVFGAGSDLEIYHDGTGSYIDEKGTGDLYIRSNGNNLRLQNYGGENFLRAVNNGTVEIYYDDSKKLATTSTGIDVTGTVTADGLTVAGASNLTNTSAGASAFALILQNQSSDTSTAVELGFDNTATADKTSSLTKIGAERVNSPYAGDTDLYFKTQTNGGSVQRLKIATTGDISFYEDTGTTAKLFWDASAESLGIGTTSPSENLHIYAASGGATLKIESNLANAYDSSKLELLGGNLSTSEILLGDASVADVGKIIYRHDGNSLAFNVASAERLRIDSSGVVDIKGAGSQSAPSLILAGDSDTGQFRPAANTIAWTTDGTERLRIDSSGRVGIGRTPLNKKLEVEGTTSNYNTILVADSTSGTTGTGGGIGFQSDNGAGVSVLVAAIQGIKENSTSEDQSGALVFAVKSPSPHTMDEAMRIDSSGNTTFKANNSAVGPVVTLENTATAVNGQAWGSIHFDSNDLSTGASGTRASIVGTSTSFNGDGNLDFYTAPASGTNTFAMRIDSARNLLVGTTDSSPYITTTGAVVALNDGVRVAYIAAADSTASRSAIIFTNPNGQVGSITTNASATAYNTSSDYRLKENVVAMSGATERLKQLKPSRFNFIADPDKTVDGFLAHEVQDIVPEAITGSKDAVDAEGNPEYQGIDQSKLVPLLVATIQELEARVAQLEGVN